MAGRVLVVDDSAAIRDIVRVGLTILGYSIFLAADGNEGFETFLKIKPEAVICDLYMPGMDGMALCRHLRQQGFKTPFILMTSDQSPYRINDGLLSGADRYVGKPVEVAVLHRELQALLRKLT